MMTTDDDEAIDGTYHPELGEMWGEYRLQALLLGKLVVRWHERLRQHARGNGATAPWETA